MPDVARFAIMMMAAFVAFLWVLRFAVRNRNPQPPGSRLILIGCITVMGGMFFARYSHLAFPRLPWWIFYGLPAAITVFLPPLWLRMSGREVAQYLPLAWLTAPAIHLVFSLFVGWHDYMPFPVHIPSLAEIVRLSAR